MSGFLNSSLSFWQIITTILVGVFSFIAIKITLSFDINKYLERRDEKITQSLKNACTHIEITPIENGKYSVQSLFESPPGTLQWQCQRCGLIKNHDNDSGSRANYYVKHPDEYLKMNKRFYKLLKRSGMR